VLVDNYQQTAAVSLETAAGKSMLNAHTRLMHYMESKGALNRAIEFLPDEKALTERAQLGHGLTAPEISVLLAYTKIVLKEAILASKLPDAVEFQPLLVNYFPAAILDSNCRTQIPNHPLKREIITTQIVSRLVNRMGTTFTLQVADETGADLSQIVTAWHAASELLGAEALWSEIEALDLKIPAAQQMGLMNALRDMLSAATRQILASHMADAGIAAIVDTYRDAVGKAIALARAGKNAGCEAVTAVLDARSCIVSVFELVDLARASARPLDEVATACGNLDASLDFVWFGSAIGRLPAGNRWQARARAQLASELRKLRQNLLQRKAEELQALQAAITEARGVVEELKRNAPQDLAMLSAGLAEIKRLLAA
jgi:glutamate dehydrogenase